MTGISERKSQWEREAIEAERKMIADYVRKHRLQPNSIDYLMLTGMALSIERGEYRKTEAGE